MNIFCHYPGGEDDRKPKRRSIVTDGADPLCPVFYLQL